MKTEVHASPIRRFSSRRRRLDRSFLCEKLKGAKAYDRIAAYFSSSRVEVAGEALESVQGAVRIVCHSDLSPEDVKTARAAKIALRRSWCASNPEGQLSGLEEQRLRGRFARLFELLRSGKLEVRVLPEAAFGLIHGKAGVITLSDGSKTCFLGSANEPESAWQMNYELIWEDSSPEAVEWVGEEFDALWTSPFAVPLADFVVEDLARLSEREVIQGINEWGEDSGDGTTPDPAPVVVEAPVYRKDVGLWEHKRKKG